MPPGGQGPPAWPAWWEGRLTAVVSIAKVYSFFDICSVCRVCASLWCEDKTMLILSVSSDTVLTLFVLRDLSRRSFHCASIRHIVHSFVRRLLSLLRRSLPSTRSWSRRASRPSSESSMRASSARFDPRLCVLGFAFWFFFFHGTGVAMMQLKINCECRTHFLRRCVMYNERETCILSARRVSGSFHCQCR